MADPIGVRLDCPACLAPHVCANFGAPCGGPAALVHTCQRCAHRWQPFAFVVEARAAHEEMTDAVVCYAGPGEPGYDGVGFYFYDAEYPEEGASGAYLTLEEAAREASENDYWRVRFDPEALTAAAGSEVPLAQSPAPLSVGSASAVRQR